MENFIGKHISGSFLTLNPCHNNDIILLFKDFEESIIKGNYKGWFSEEIFHVRILENYAGAFINHKFIVSFRDLTNL